MRWRLPEAAQALGVSEAYVSHLQNGNRPFSAERRARLLELERIHGCQDIEPRRSESTYGRMADAPVYSLHEDQSPYDGGGMILPTAEVLHAYLDRVIEEAQGAPGGLHYVAAQMKIHLDLDQIRKLSKK